MVGHNLIARINHIRASSLIAWPVIIFPAIAATTTIEKITVFADQMRELIESFRPVVVDAKIEIWRGRIWLPAVDTHALEFVLQVALISFIASEAGRRQLPTM